jgi:hypothetical protein
MAVASDDVLNEDWIKKNRMVRSHRLLSLVEAAWQQDGWAG